MNTNTTQAIIGTLRNLDLSTYPVDEITSNICQLRHFPVHATEFHVGNVVYRIRPNENGKSFKHVHDLSYKPQEYNTTYQRASQPGLTMFYGSIIPKANQQSEIDIGRLIALAEGSKLFKSSEIQEGQEVVTFGIWRLQSTVSLATILHPEIKKNISPFAKQRAKDFMEWLCQHPDIEEQGKAILEFYAEQFAKRVKVGDPDYHYLHSALLVDFMIKKGFDGVCYPSGRVEGKGINVAIHPNFVNDYMRLEGAMECIISKRGKKFACENSKIAWLNAGETELNFKEIDTPEHIQANIETTLNTD